MRGNKGVLRNLGILTVAQVAAQLANLGALIFLARYLGDRWFGIIQVGVAVSAYALITAEWGLNTLGVREIARIDQPDQVRLYARQHQGLLLVLALVVLAVGAGVLHLFPFYQQDPLVFLLYLALVIPQIWNHEWIGIGLERVTQVGIARTLISLIYAVAVVLMLPLLAGHTGWPAGRWVPALYLGAVLLGNLALVFPVRNWLGGWVYPTLARSGDWKRRLGQSGPIGASIVTMRVLMNGDMIMLGILAPPEIAGRYAAAAKIGFLLVLAMELLWKALLPRFSRLAKESPAEFLNRFQLYFGLVAAGLLPLAVGALFVGTDLMHLLYGAAYSGVGSIFQILACSYTLLALAWFLGNTLLAADRQKEFFPPLLVSALVALAGNFLFIPRFQGLGAALGMLASHLILLLILVVICRSWFGTKLLGAGLWIATGLLAMAAALYLLQSWPVLLRIPLAGLVYLALTGWRLRFWARDMTWVEPSAKLPDQVR